MLDVVDGARKQEKPHLVNARHRLKLRGAQPRAVGEEFPAFHVCLRIRRIVIAPEHEVVKDAALRIVDELFVRREVLRAATHPVFHGLFRNQLLQEGIFLLFPGCQAFDFLLVRQERVAKDVRAVVLVVARLFRTRRLTRARRAHDRAEDVERQRGMRCAEVLEVLETCHDLTARAVVLP